jgi:polyribonucleotide nucleotidyltransferase
MLAEKVGRKETRTYDKEAVEEALEATVQELAYQACYELAKSNTAKQERTDRFSDLFNEIKEKFTEEELEEKLPLIARYFGKVKKSAIRDLTLKEGIRLDGRATTDIRPISCEIDYLPSAHGSALFTRGETQSLTTVTLGTSRESKMVDTPSYSGEEKFYLHYNFPPFSTGEAKPLRGTSRREIGHGNLAQRALQHVIPEDCPYTVRVVSEILESNGSSSMATVCAGTMALMDAGIKISKPVSGIAMGLISKGDEYAVLSDILGDEDFLGDMDFKVTGTKDGITACQMDIKIKGLSYEILENALNQAKEGRLHILNKMEETIDAPTNSVKAHAPKIITKEIPGEFIGAIIGSGGKTIQELQKDTNTTIVIEEVNGKGVVEILGTNQDGIDKVLAKIEAIMFKPTVGDTYQVTVVKMLDFGAVVEFNDGPGNEMLLHISELAWERVADVKDVINMGDTFEVKYFGIDQRTRKPKISKKALLKRPERTEQESS